MDAAALAISIIALGVSAASVWYTRRSSHASEDSAREARRSADAVQEATSYQRDEVERRRINFVLERVGQHSYAVHNYGTDTAFGVHVETADLGMGDEIADFDEFGPGHAEQLILARGLDSTTTHIKVSWYRQPDLSDEAQSKRLLVEF
jgi:hypothetical protein